MNTTKHIVLYARSNWLAETRRSICEVRINFYTYRTTNREIYGWNACVNALTELHGNQGCLLIILTKTIIFYTNLADIKFSLWRADSLFIGIETNCCNRFDDIDAHSVWVQFFIDWNFLSKLNKLSMDVKSVTCSSSTRWYYRSIRFSDIKNSANLEDRETIVLHIVHSKFFVILWSSRGWTLQKYTSTPTK